MCVLITIFGILASCPQEEVCPGDLNFVCAKNVLGIKFV